MKQTFTEFSRDHFKRFPDSDPDIVMDGWIYQVSEAIKSGRFVSKRVLTSVSSICFDSKGNAFYK